MLCSKGAAWFCSSHVSSVCKVLGLILIFKAWIMQFKKSKNALQQGSSPLHNKVQGPEVEAETVSQISLICLHHTSVYTQLEVEIKQKNTCIMWSLRAVCTGWQEYGFFCWNICPLSSILLHQQAGRQWNATALQSHPLWTFHNNKKVCSEQRKHLGIPTHLSLT